MKPLMLTPQDLADLAAVGIDPANDPGQARTLIRIQRRARGEPVDSRVYIVCDLTHPGNACPIETLRRGLQALPLTVIDAGIGDPRGHS